MNFSVWEYMRRRTCDAVLAGVRDALEQLETQDQAAAIFQAARQLRQKLQESQAAKPGNGQQATTDANRRPENQSASFAKLANGSNHQNASTNGAPHPAVNGNQDTHYSQNHVRGNTTPGGPPNHQQHRKVGRPRKETHG